jgi:RimJ/RimL family protein N-acetyltransferase
VTRLIYGDDAALNERLAAWAARRIPTVGDVGFGPCRAVGVASGNGGRGDKLLAVIVYSSFDRGCIQISAAADSPKWATPGNVRALLAYPFITLGCRKVWTGIAHDNARSLRFNRGIGMRQEATLRYHYGPKSHAVIMSMLRNEWARRWAPKGFDACQS